MVDIWREETSVRFGSVDCSNRLTVGSIFSFFQEAAISHAADLGVGVNDLAEKKQVWVLSRFSLFIERRPAYGETIKISSWPRKWEKLFAIRDYEIRDREDRSVVRGRAGWLVLDIEKRRPLRVEAILNGLPPNEGIDVFPRTGVSASPVALDFKSSSEKKAERTALYSDIDYYGHVNNARYVQWIQDLTDMETLTKTDQVRLDINYLSEVKPRETVELWMAPLETGAPDAGGSGLGDAAYPSRPGPGFFYEGRRPVSGQAVFRAELRTGW